MNDKNERPVSPLFSLRRNFLPYFLKCLHCPGFKRLRGLPAGKSLSPQRVDKMLILRIPGKFQIILILKGSEITFRESGFLDSRNMFI